MDVPRAVALEMCDHSLCFPPRAERDVEGLRWSPREVIVDGIEVMDSAGVAR